MVLGEVSPAAHTWSANRSSGGEEKQIYVRIDLRNYREVDPEMEI